jgi:hypothetical protein
MRIDGALSRRVAKKLVLLLNEERMGLTKRELAVVAETHQCSYIVWIKKAEGGFWRVEIHLGDKDRVYEIDTTRGVPKGWRQLSDAIIFVQENCKHPKDVFVEVGEWVLTKKE